MARRQHSLHHNLQDGQNVVFHREHRSKKGRKKGFAERKRKLGYVVERRDRIIDRKVKHRLKKFVQRQDFNDRMTA